MGIEPTGRMLYIRPNGFEDRGRHQANRHFHLGIVTKSDESNYSHCKVETSFIPENKGSS